MNIADSIIKNKLKNVYFIWGSGKTTIANRLNEKYGFYVYSTDESRNRQTKIANPVDQPYMCRDFEKEYGVKSFWELPKDVIAERETHFVAEMTPMIVAELIQLSSLHKVIICEGDIDYYAIAPVAAHMVHLCNQSASFDWFDRPDHENIRDTVAKRTDLSDEEKQRVIERAYECVTPAELSAPGWVAELGIKNIIWNDHTSIDTTAVEVAEYFGFTE
ncbi:MAG TPA: hypothetical protein DCS04_02860 [Ruminococcaceae bacterium]|nr:hypothetical protein [Oscillospiraceae bacterium]